MIRRALRFDVPARTAVVIVVAVVLLAAVGIAWAARERSVLPGEAHDLLRAAISAEGLTSCLHGVEDTIYLPSGKRAEITNTVRGNALGKLATCDIARLERDIAAVDLPPAPPPPLIDSRRRKARGQVEDGLALLRAAAVDAREAKRALREDIAGRPNLPAYDRAYEPADDASHRAFLLAYTALGLLKEQPTPSP